MNVDGSMSAPLGDDTDLAGMLNFSNDNFMDTDDLVGGMLPIDLDLDNIPSDTNQQLDAAAQLANSNAAAGAAAAQSGAVEPSIEGNADLHALADTMSGPGAGPLPASYGVQLPPNTGSTLTEFTKRRNWSQRVIEELKDFLHVLTPDGRILYASPSAHFLTGHDPQTLAGQFISDFIHPDDNAMFVREFNESIASGNALRFFYRFRRPDGSYAIFESHGHPHIAADASSYANSGAAPLCRGFFMMSRPYPTKNAALLDSFLEHKIENERLRKRIADLKREEQEDLEEQQRQHNLRQMESGSVAAGQSTPADITNMRSTSGQSDSPQNFDGMPPPAKPDPSNLALTRANLNNVLASSRPDSINDKMARYEGFSHLESIEMLTGLRYRDGERSKGISTGAASPTLVRGDQGIAISVDRDRFGRSYSGSPYGDVMSDRDKKKKMKVADEYVCTDCGTLDSPEWRKGPTGPKTLCNACGLRWAKKEKKKSTSEATPNGTNHGGNGSSISAKHSGGNGTGGNGANLPTGHSQGSVGTVGGGQGMMMPGQQQNMMSSSPIMMSQMQSLSPSQQAQMASGMQPMNGLPGQMSS